jgi:hypothetical protein
MRLRLTGKLACQVSNLIPNSECTASEMFFAPIFLKALARCTSTVR